MNLASVFSNRESLIQQGGRPRMAVPAGRLLAALFVAWLVAASLPKLPFPIPKHVDGAWYYALNLIHRDGGRIGPDIAFTMGPLGYLTVPDAEITPWWQALLLRAIGWAALAWGLARLVKAWPPWAAAAAAGVLCSMGSLAYHYPDTWQASSLALFLALIASPSAAGFAVTGVFVGITLLVKANEALIALSLYAVLVAAHRRSLPKGGLWFLGIPAAILLAGCQAFNGGMWTAWPYVRWAMEVVRGYTEAATMPGPVWQLGLLLLFWAVLFAVPLMDAGPGCFRHPAWWCALLHAFQGFKHGMVRQDGHADLSMARLAVCAFFLLATVREQAYRKALVLLAVFGCAFTWVHMSEVRQLHFRRASAYFTPGGIAATVRDLARYPARYLEVGRRSREIRSSLVLGEAFHARVGGGSVDAFPDQIDTIRANGWRYVPRPTIDAITAFTQSMNQFNASHMQGERAPEFMLFYFAAIDGRHPMLQDTGTLRAMFERYDLVEEGADVLLLQRRGQAPGLQLRPVGETSVGWEEGINPPTVRAPEVLWASFEIDPSPWGRLRWFLFRTDWPLLQADYADGVSPWYRLLREIAREPMPLSPLPRNLREAAMYWRNEPLPEGAEVKRIVLRTLGREQYAPRIRVRWFAASR